MKQDVVIRRLQMLFIFGFEDLIGQLNVGVEVAEHFAAPIGMTRLEFDSADLQGLDKNLVV